jgi:hypothetical protein
MKQVRFLSIVALLWLVAAVRPGFADFELMQGEHFGKLKLGLSREAVTQLLGRPASRTPETLEAATGDYIQMWKYPRLGVTLKMGSSERHRNALQVSTIEVEAPSRLVTARGVSIGSRAEDARRLYQKEIDKETSRPDLIVAGSIYGGLMFTIKNGRVTRMFLGAGAE